MSNNIVPEETSNSGGNKRKRSPEREAGKNGQNTLLNYLSSPKNGEKKSAFTRLKVTIVAIVPQIRWKCKHPVYWRKRANRFIARGSNEMQAMLVGDWRLGCWGFASIRNKARKQGLFTDIQFIVGQGGQRKSFHAHKVILASASPVFECMFYGSMANHRTFIETNDDPEAFEMLLDYIYSQSSDMKIKSLTTAQKFFTICEKYLIYKTEEKAKECIKDIYVNDKDFWNIIEEINHTLSCPLLCDKLNDYIMRETDAFFLSDKWLSAPQTVVENILKMDKLNTDEYTLLKEVTRWVYHNKKHVTPKILIPFYKHIRFSTLVSYHLMDFITKYPKALEAGTYIDILRHLHAKSERKLPDWCSTSDISRRKELHKLIYEVNSNQNNAANDDDDEEEEEDDD